MDQLTRHIIAWMSSPENNAIEPGADLPAFDLPLVGCASGADPLFLQMKQDIGPDFYWTPAEAYALAFPKDEATADELSVIAWVLPQTAHTRRAHRKAGELPSRAWSCARHYGELVNEGLRRSVVAALAARGINALAPVLLPQWTRAESPRFGFASSWSERHAAHACGLGTFGLSDGLITPAGKAVRVGSVVARHRWPPTPRPYTTHTAWCLHFSAGKCRSCIKRCPAGAISETGHDKTACKAYIRSVTAPYVAETQLGFPVNSCGLCQTGVPCESRNPTAAKSHRTNS